MGKLDNGTETTEKARKRPEDYGLPPRGPGRPKGSQNRATQRAREAIAMLVDDNAPKLVDWLDEIAEKEGPLVAWKCMMDVIEYHVPKLSRTEHTGPDGGPQQHSVTLEVKGV